MLNPIKIEDIPKYNRHIDSNAEKIRQELKEFIDSDNQAVEIIEHGYKSLANARSCIDVIIRKSGYPLKIFIRNKRIFIVKENVE